LAVQCQMLSQQQQQQQQQQQCICSIQRT